MAVMKDDIDNGKIAFVAVLGVILVLVSILLVQALYFHMMEDQRQESKVSKAPDWRGYASDQQAKLNGYGWVDQGKGVVRIPVERAMSLVIAEHQGKRAQRADGVPTD